jgi:hypothetical protein
MNAALGRFYERTHACPCGSGRIASWYIDEKKEPVRACERCRAALLTRLLAASLRERFGSDASNETVVAFLTAHGCRFLDDVVEAARSQSPETILARCPLRPEQFVLVPKGLAERVLLGGGVG